MGINWLAVAAVSSIVGIIFTVCAAAYTSGRLTQKIQDHDETLVEHGETLKTHTKQLGEHELGLDRLTQWKNGFNAAANISGSHERPEA